MLKNEKTYKNAPRRPIDDFRSSTLYKSIFITFNRLKQIWLFALCVSSPRFLVIVSLDLSMIW